MRPARNSNTSVWHSRNSMQVQGVAPNRALIATEAIAEGTSIEIETDISTAQYALLRQHWTTHCQFCLTRARGEGVIRCACGAVHCDAQCKRKSSHTQECVKLERLKLEIEKHIDISDIVLLARAYGTLSSHVKDLAIIPSVKQEISTDPTCARISALANKLYSRVPEDAEKTHRVQAQFRANNFMICDESLQPIAQLIAPRAALLNHSCAPNVCATYALSASCAPRQIFVALRDISVGEELVHSYVDACHPPYVRAQSLKNRYGFECACARCTNPYEIDLECTLNIRGELDRACGEFLHQSVNLLSSLRRHYISDPRKEIDALASLVKQAKERLHPNHWFMRMVAVQLMQACLVTGDTGDTRTAAALNRYLLERDLKALCSRVHPQIVMETQIMHELEMVLQENE